VKKSTAIQSIISIALVIVILVIYINQSRSARIAPELPPATPVTPAAPASAPNHYAFEPLGEADANRKIAKRFPITLHTHLSKDEYTQLMESIGDMLTIYENHDFQAFKMSILARQGKPSAVWAAGIASVGIFHDPEHLPTVAKALYHQSHPWPPTDNWVTLQTWWEARYAERGVWKGVQLSDAHLDIFERMGEPTRDDQDTSVASIAGRASIRLFQDNHFFAPAQGTTKFAFLTFVTEHQGNDPVFPMYLWFRWDPALHKWILDKAAQPYSDERSGHCDLIL